MIRCHGHDSIEEKSKGGTGAKSGQRDLVSLFLFFALTFFIDFLVDACIA